MIIDIKSTIRGGYSQWWRLDCDSLDPYLEEYLLNLVFLSEVHNLPPELLADLAKDTDEPCYIVTIESESSNQTVKIRQATMTNSLKQLVREVAQNVTDRGGGTWEDYYLQQRIRRELQPIMARLVQQPLPGLNQNPQLANYLAGQLLDLVLDWKHWQSQSTQTSTTIEEDFRGRLKKKTEQLLRRGPLQVIH